MAAMPAAPASRQEWALERVTPPSANTGILAAQAWWSAVRPAGDAPFFSKTGAKTANVAPFSAACMTSAGEWQETAICGAGGEGWRTEPGPHFFHRSTTSCG